MLWESRVISGSGVAFIITQSGYHEENIFKKNIRFSTQQLKGYNNSEINTKLKSIIFNRNNLTSHLITPFL